MITIRVIRRENRIVVRKVSNKVNIQARAKRGLKGSDGEAATIEVGSVTTGAPGTQVIVTNSGTESDAVLNFTIPEGEKGDGSATQWGGVQGDIQDQTDLQAQFDTKYDASNPDGYITQSDILVDSVQGRTGDVVINKTDIGLSNVPNLNTTTAVSQTHTHANKALLDSYSQTEVDIASAVTQRHSHTNKSILDATTSSFTTAKDTKLSGIATGAEVNVNPDWNAASGDAQILNKPTIPTLPENIVQSVIAGTNVTVDNTDPENPIISAAGGGGGAVSSVNGQTGIVVLNQDDILDGTTNKQYTSTEKTKLSGIASGAEVNVNADWNAVSGDALILNKPSIPSTANLFNKTTDDSDDITQGTLNLFLTTAERTKITNTSGINTGDQTLSSLGVTATATEINILDGVTASTAELNYTDGVTSNIQTQIDGKTSNTGTVTSVGVTVPTGLSVTGSPIATSGTAAISYTAGYQGYTSTEATKLSGVESGAQVNTVTSVASKTGAVSLVKADVGLSNVDNTSDLSKPISTLTQTALDDKPSYSELADVAYSGSKADIGLGSVDNTSDLAKPISTATQTALNAKATNPMTTAGDIIVAGSSGVPTRLATSAANNQVLRVGTAGTAPVYGKVGLSTDVTGTTPVSNGGTGRATATTAYGLIAAGTSATGVQQTIAPGTAGQFLKSAGSAALAGFSAIAESDVTNLVTDLAAKQPIDSDLTAIAALDSTTSGAIASDGTGWVKKTYAQLKTALGLVKSDVGLSNVDNTTDLSKPISTATQTALDTKSPQNLIGLYSARPAANTVLSGTQYRASDVREVYRSDGSVWTVVGGGGEELGFAEITSGTTNTSSTPIDVTALTTTFTVGERPIFIDIHGTCRNATSGGYVWLYIYLDGTDIKHSGGSTQTFTPYSFGVRVSGLTPGSTHTAKVMIGTPLGGGTAEISANAQDKAYIRAVTQ